MNFPFPLVTSVALIALLLHAIVCGMTFTVDDAWVRVRVYGSTVRKVALADIEYAESGWVFWNEHWTSTLNPRRMVLLRRRTGLVKNFVISPPNAAIFLTQLQARGVVTKA